MKHITKGAEPAEFTQWKQMIGPDWDPAWEDLPSNIKGPVLESLINEQGNICCYCTMEIDPSNSHPEHLKPRNWERDRKAFAHLKFAYENLLASCGRTDASKQPRHCGRAKDNWYDQNQLVSPLDPACEQRFLCAADGGIYPADPDDTAAGTTITRLALHIDKLRAMREKAIEGAMEGIANMSSEQIQAEIEKFRARNPDGCFAPFCVAIVQVLSSLV